MKWISLDDKKPKCCDKIIFSDEKNVYFGWLETYEFGEEPMFYAAYKEEWPDNVTHWMPLPKPPEVEHGMD